MLEPSICLLAFVSIMFRRPAVGLSADVALLLSIIPERALSRTITRASSPIPTTELAVLASPAMATVGAIGPVVIMLLLLGGAAVVMLAIKISILACQELLCLARA